MSQLHGESAELDRSSLGAPRVDPFGDLTRLAALLCGAQVARITVADTERPRFRSIIGLEAEDRTPVDSEFRELAMRSATATVVCDAREDPRFSKDGLAAESTRFRFFAGVPIHDHVGRPVGALYVADRSPRTPTIDQLDGLSAIGRLIDAQIDVRTPYRVQEVRPGFYEPPRVSSRAPDATSRPDASCSEQRRSRSTFEHATIGMALLDARGGIVAANRALREMLGECASAGATAAGLAREFASLIHDGDRPEWQARVRPLLARESPTCHLDQRLRAKDGRIINAELSLTALDDDSSEGAQFLCQVRDVSRRHSAEQRLRRYELLAERATDLILFVGLDGRIVEANEAATRAYGYPRSELVGKSIRELEVDASGDRDERSVQSATLEGIRFDARHRCHDGSTFFVEVSAQRTDGGSDGVILAIIRDVTERRRAEQGLIESRARLSRAKEAAENASRAKTMFLGSMSHELRTPLNAILGFSQVLDKGHYGVLNDRQTRYVRHIHESGALMLRIVDDLLELRRLEEGGSTTEATPLALRPILEDAVAMASSSLSERGVTVRVEVPDELGGVLADRAAVAHVASSLLSNAAKRALAGATLTVRARAADRCVSIEITEFSGRVGEAAAAPGSVPKAPAGDARRANGLALSAALIERLGGSLRVDTSGADGIGACAFTLPSAKL